MPRLVRSYKITPAKASARVKKGWKAFSPKQRSERLKKIWSKIPQNERSARGSRVLKRGWDKLSPKGKSRRGRKALMARSPDQRSESSRKSWESPKRIRLRIAKLARLISPAQKNFDRLNAQYNKMYSMVKSIKVSGKEPPVELLQELAKLALKRTVAFGRLEYFQSDSRMLEKKLREKEQGVRVPQKN